MTTLGDVRLAVVRELRNGTDIKNIYGEEIHKRNYPLLQVNIMPVSFSTAAAGSHTEKNLLVDVLFMEEDFTSYESNYRMLETIDSILRPVIVVGDRSFTVQNASMEITDQMAHYKFYLEFTDTGARKEEIQIPFMEDLGIRF